MTHLRIEQNTTGIEEVSSAVIKKLYDLVYSGTLDNTSNLLGRLHTTSTYQSYVDYLTGLYPNLYITANKLYALFTDPVVELMAATKWGDGVGVSTTELATVTGTLPVTGFDFYLNTDVTSLDDLNYFTGVTEIRDRFARGATNLTSITIPGNITRLSYTNGDNSFYGIFRGCTSLTNVTLNEGIEAIMNRCFMDCTSLLSIDIPSTVKYLSYDTTTEGKGYGVFAGCSSLSNVTGGEGILVLGNGCFFNCSSLTSLPDFNFSNITKIGENCFRGAKLSGTLDLSNLTNIYTYTFDHNNITSVNIPNVTLIDERAFLECRNLTTVNNSSNVTSIGPWTFSHCVLLSTIDTSNVTTMGNGVFYNCSNLNNINTSNVTTIGSQAFQGCTSLSSIDLTSITTIGDSAFRSCSGLTSIDFSNCTNLTTIGARAFQGTSCSLFDLSNTKIINGTLNMCFCNGSDVNTTVIFPTTFTKIPTNFCDRCNQITNLTFVFNSPTVVTVDTNQSYTSAVYKSSVFFGGIPSNLRIYVPDALVNDYISEWGSDFLSHIYPISLYTSS